ncbi:hypothetical protein LO772_07840 [Yinghuangia sp. ASG 101]|uniref:hypothetical protein n=1 Tax=Yinghuangia sp. ASG 101 TaxID=2896848 RepID=UPI001E529325|nr:hypothetical protein [Yinghuangia sp. ASG 101]UGQ13507.1 hypothetical protein LO772_07840 [Yinghuangia sp. ASG 101]
MLLVGVQATVGAPQAAAAPETGDCLYVPEDYIGFRYRFYCAGDGSHDVHKENKDDNYVNGGLGPCADISDNSALAAGQHLVFDFPVWNDSLGEELVENALPILRLGDAWGYFSDITGSTKTECVKEMTYRFLANPSGNFFNRPVSDYLKDNPCTGLVGEKRSLCRNPIGANPCLALGSGSFTGPHASAMKQQCLDDHPHFRMTDLSQQPEARAASVSPTVVRGLSELLGYALLGALCLCLVGVILSAGGMAMAWYTGHPAPVHFMRLGWVLAASVIAASSTGIAAIFVY